MAPSTSELIRDLGMNAGLIALLAVVYGAATTRSRSLDPAVRSTRNGFLLFLGGLLFGGVGIASMMAPIHVTAGVIMDAKTLVTALAGAYLPAWPATLAVGMIAGYRMHLGGAGMFPALVAIGLSAAVGYGMRTQRHRFEQHWGRLLGQWLWLVVFGLCVALAALTAMLLLPAAVLAVVLPVMWLPVLVIYPLAIVAFAYLMDGSLELRRRTVELEESAARMAKLLAQTRQAASVFHNSRDTIAIMAPDGTVLDVNPMYCEVMGYTREELVGQSSARLRMDDGGEGAFLRSVLQAIEEKGRWQGELARKKKSGEVFLSDITIDALRDERGQLIQLVSLGRDLSEKRRLEEAVLRAARFDPLTGLPNRQMLHQQLEGLLARVAQEEKRTGRATLVAVCVLDMDHFKALNARFGSSACDGLLREQASVIRRGADEGNLMGRIAGDEFVVVLSDCRDQSEALDRVEALRRALAQPMRLGAEEVRLCASVGMTFFPDDASDAEGLLRHADLAMYSAKEQGRDRIYVYDSLKDVRAQARRETVRRIDAALDQHEMELFFQPKIRLSDGAVVGAEALIRWRHPDRGLLAPGVFLDQIEGTPTAAKLDYWVLAEALRQASAWQAEGVLVPVSVNMTVSTLIEPRFLQEIGRLLAQHASLPPQFLEVELLETETMNDLSMVAFVMQDLAEMGVQCSIDDFGTGYSSLTYLQRLPAQTIKIDQSFVRDMLESDRDRTLVRGVISLAKAFERQVVAEGVESDLHAATLNEMGCDVLQGYAIARPMPARDMPAWVAGWRIPSSFMSDSVRATFEDLVRRIGS